MAKIGTKYRQHINYLYGQDINTINTSVILYINSFTKRCLNTILFTLSGLTLSLCLEDLSRVNDNPQSIDSVISYPVTMVTIAFVLCLFPL